MSFTGIEDEILTGELTPSDNFFPPFNLDKFQKAFNLPGEAHQDLVKSKVERALIEVMFALMDFKTITVDEWENDQEDPAISHIESVTFEQGGQSIYVLSYFLAVSLRAKSYILDELKSEVRKDTGENLAKDSPETSSMLFAKSIAAINYFYDEGLNGISLI